MTDKLRRDMDERIKRLGLDNPLMVNVTLRLHTLAPMVRLEKDSSRGEACNNQTEETGEA